MNTKIQRFRGHVAALTTIVLLPITFVLTSCAPDRPAVTAFTEGQVFIKGSNTFGDELAPRLVAAYRGHRPKVTVSIEAKGSASGFAALLAGECDLAASSRDPTPDEKAQASARGVEWNTYTIGYYGVSVIVNPANPVEKLTSRQVKDIFTGAVRNWTVLGGPDAPIRVCIRDPLSGTNPGFRELAMDNAPYAGGAREFTNYTQLVEAVAQDVGAVGYASMSMAEQKGIKALAIGQYAPTALTVNEGYYPYARMLRLYTNKASEPPLARDFALFVQRRSGQDILEELGFVRRFERRLDTLIPE